jgi:hypothetical protein
MSTARKVLLSSTTALGTFVLSSVPSSAQETPSYTPATPMLTPEIAVTSPDEQGSPATTAAAPADEPTRGGLLLTFGVEFTLETRENMDLEVVPEDRVNEFTTRLSFGLLSETRSHRLEFLLSDGFPINDDPNDQDSGRVRLPAVFLSYTREAANAAFSITGSYVRDRVDDVSLGRDFVDEGPNVPNDTVDLQGGGYRSDYSLAAELNLGTVSPIGLDLSAGVFGVDYLDNTDPDLVDSRNEVYDATVRLRFSPITESRVTLLQEQYTEEGTGRRQVDTSAIELGLNHQISEANTIDLAFGYRNVDTDEFGILERHDGPTAALALTREMANGFVDTRFISSINENGNFMRLDFGRSIDLPEGALAGRVGVEQLEGNSAVLVGDIDWLRALPSGAVTARFSRDVEPLLGNDRASVNSNDQSITTLVAFGTTHDINPLSAIDLELIFALVEETGVEDVKRSDLSLTYRREITRNWDMNMGLVYRTRKEDRQDQATGNSVFLTLSRPFEVRP